MSKVAPLTFTRALQNQMNAGVRDRGTVYEFERGDVRYQAHVHGAGVWSLVTICASSGEGRAWRWCKDVTTARGVLADVLRIAMRQHVALWEVQRDNAPAFVWTVGVETGPFRHESLTILAGNAREAMAKGQHYANRMRRTDDTPRRLVVSAQLHDDQTSAAIIATLNCPPAVKAEHSAKLAAEAQALADESAPFTDPDELATFKAVMIQQGAARADAQAVHVESAAVTGAEVIALRALFDSIHAHDAAGLSPMDDPLLSELAQMTGDAGRVSALLGELLTHRAVRR